MTAAPDRPAETSGLSEIEEYSARALLAKPRSGADDLLLLRALLRKALETVTDQRLSISTLASLPSTQAIMEGKATRTPREIVAALRGAEEDAPYVFSGADVEFEIEASHRVVRASWGLTVGIPGQRAMLEVALWHRRRAAAIARIVEEQEQRRGWCNVDLLLPDTSWRRATFYGGPLDREDRAVNEPVWSMWLARREGGEGLGDMTFVHPAIGSVTCPNDPSTPPPPLPDGGSLLGLYVWEVRLDRYEWVACDTEEAE
jgi:hypothetical protein